MNLDIDCFSVNSRPFSTSICVRLFGTFLQLALDQRREDPAGTDGVHGGAMIGPKE